MEELELGIGDEITVYKANMIIPQLAENKTKSGHMEIPEYCPACGGETKIESDHGIKTLVCTNEFCSAKNKVFLTFCIKGCYECGWIIRSNFGKND